MQILKRLGPWLVAALLSSPGLAVAEIPNALEDSCEDALLLLHQKIQDNRFITDRLALDYERQTSGFFGEALYRTPRDGHWIDAGAGDAKAQLEYMGLFRAPTRRMSPSFMMRAQKGFRATAVSYQIPISDHGDWLQSQDFTGTGFQYIHGSYIESLPAGTLQAADLITDMYGPLAYTTDFSAMLELYRSLLTENGELIFLTSVGYNQIQVNGETIFLEKWLLQNYASCGLEARVRWDDFRHENPFKVAAFRWSKKDIDRCQLPKLRLVSMKVAGPPYRLFELAQ